MIEQLKITEFCHWMVLLQTFASLHPEVDFCKTLIMKNFSELLIVTERFSGMKSAIVMNKNHRSNEFFVPEDLRTV